VFDFLTAVWGVMSHFPRVIRHNVILAAPAIVAIGLDYVLRRRA